MPFSDVIYIAILAIVGPFLYLVAGYAFGLVAAGMTKQALSLRQQRVWLYVVVALWPLVALLTLVLAPLKVVVWAVEQTMEME